MKFGIVQFPGTTCHKDLYYVINEIMEQEAIFLWHKDTDFPKVDAIIVPGHGINQHIVFEEIYKKSPVIKHIHNFASKGGFVFGTGDGFRFLCETGLLPGTVTMNHNQKFVCKNVFIKPIHNQSSITALLDTNLAYKVPIATKYGNYQTDDNTVKGLRENKQILFLYCDEDGHLTEDANPTGSRGNIAGICNKEKNVYGLLVHPERASDDELGNTDGRAVFESIIAYLR